MPQSSNLDTPELRTRCIRAVLILGGLVSLVGFLGIVGYAFGLRALLTFGMPSGTPMLLPGALGMLFLGFALQAVLAGSMLDEKPRWLAPVQHGALLVTSMMGVFVFVLYLDRADYNLMAILTQDVATIIPAFLENLILLMASAALFAFMLFRHKEVVVVYVVNVLALLILSLDCFIFVGFRMNIPVLFSFKLSLPIAMAYFLTAIAILVGTIPFRGILAPLVSDSRMSRLILWSGLITGLSVLLVGAYDISQFERYISHMTLTGTHPDPSFMYLRSELVTIILALVITVLSLRTIHYFNRSAFFAREQALAKEEAETVRENYRILVEGVTDYAIFMVDPMGHVVTWNTGAERIIGYASDEILGRHFSCFYVQDDLNQGRPDYEIRMAIENGRFEQENWCKRHDGSVFWANIVITAHVDESGQLIGLSRITRDITERKRAAELLQRSYDELEHRVAERTEELSRANAQLQETERLRWTFISTLTHDLRTPLIAQKRVLEVLLRKMAHDPESAELVGGFLKNNDHLVKMVNMLLETYQYEDGCIQLNIEPFRLHQLVSDCFDEVHSLALVQEIRLRNAVPASDSEILGDFYQLKRVFLNLLGNAIENIPPGSVIEVSVVNLDADRIRICVSDTGQGISPDMLPHLFDRYFTGHSTRQKIGSGLGLFICKMIVDLHGGIIEAKSELGQGTTFEITLPRRGPEAPVERTIEAV